MFKFYKLIFLAIKAPFFINLKKDTNNRFYSKHGKKVQCVFKIDAVQIRNDKEINNIFLNNQEKQHSLRFINLESNTIIKEKSIDIKKARLLTNPNSILYFSNAILDIETKKLEPDNSYSCCLGFKFNNYSCSILTFDNFLTNSFESNNIIQDIKNFNSKIRSIEKILLITSIGFLSIFLILLIYIIKIKNKRYKNKTDDAAIISPHSQNLFSIETKFKQNDLYQQYNLSNENRNNKIVNIHCNECPPSYEELSKKEKQERF